MFLNTDKPKKGGYLLPFIFLSFTVIFGQSTNDEARISGFIDFNAYYDTREFSVFTYNILANLPKRFQYFSLTNYQSALKSTDVTTNYAEHNLRWAIGNTSPIDLTLQYVLRNGIDNDDVRFGFRWRVANTKGLSAFFKKLHFSYAINPMLVQFRRKTNIKIGTQIEHVYRLLIAPNKLNNRLYLSGFIDQNIVYADSGSIYFRWVSEHQLGYQILNNLYTVLEYRINDFFTTIHKTGLGYGLQYKIIF